MNKDLISRQDAIKEVSKYVHSVDMIIGNGTLSMAGCIDTAEEILAELPSIEPEHKWISCDKELPKREERSYWVCLENGYQIQCKWKRYEGKDGDIYQWHSVSKVVAWRELPNPYKGGDSE